VQCMRMAPYAGAATSATCRVFPAPTCRSPESGRRAQCPHLWSDPPGVPGVACRRGTCGCPGIMSEPRSEGFSIQAARISDGVDSAARKSQNRWTRIYSMREPRSAATRPGWVVLPCLMRGALPPRICRQTATTRAPARSVTRPQRVCGRRRRRPTPCAQPSTGATRGAQPLRHGRRGRDFAVPRQNLRRAPSSA